MARCLLAIGMLNASANVLAEDGKQELVEIAQLVHTLDERYPAGSIQSNEVAEIAIKESQSAEDRLENWYVVSEHHCYNTFFVNDCLKRIKVERREYLPTLQRISLESQALQRLLKVMERDRETAQKQAK
ncbi:hypothetical protein H8K32_01670 [Undibacterium jejuense]|uniref:Uncharacterized protein n=2 Tax=Undibacterium jejuense TaxID=1344949 RepID=A0A923HFR1_9BURK|nr:hypothetical protein [Undibacterium jejuense]